MRTFWSTAKHYWQIHLIVALCTAVATGVLAGALIVGDSMRGSLRDITLERLGTIQHALIADHFFKPELLNRQNMVPAILLNGTVVAAETETRASKVNIYGVDNTFFRLWEDHAVPNLNSATDSPFANIVINEALQNELKVQIGDAILVNFPQAVEIHPEFLLGKRDAADVIQRLRLIVGDIIRTEKAGRFSLQTHQSLPLNAYIALPVLQKALAQSGKVNALFTTEPAIISPDSLTLTLEELGLYITEHENHIDLQSQQFLLEPVMSETALSVASQNEIPTLPTLTYLANTISTTDSSQQDESTNPIQKIPYSTILALPVEEGVFADFVSKYTTEETRIKYAHTLQQELKLRKSKKREEIDSVEMEIDRIRKEVTKLKRTTRQQRTTQKSKQNLAEVKSAISEVESKLNVLKSPIELSEIYLNRWAADDLGVKVGDKINVTYYSVSADEDYITENEEFILKGIVPIESIAADTNLIPKFPGIHNTTDISEWEPPFTIDYSLIRSKDEDYWDKYKATPKAFVSLDAGKRLWQNRFGDLTTIRMGAATGRDISTTRSLFETEYLKEIKPEQIGFQFLSLQQEGLKASSGSTDFGMLFSSLSFFIILAAATLVSTIFAIGVSKRSREIGILQAVGYPLAKIRHRFLFEGIFIASIGSLLGCLLAIGYARLMIFGLQTWWLPAIGTPFIDLHISGWSLLFGILVTLAVVTFFIRHVVQRLGKAPTAALLAGETDFDETSRKPKPQSANVSRIETTRITIFIMGLFFGTMDKGKLFTGDWSGIIIVILLAACGLFGFHLARKRDDGTNPNLTLKNVKISSIFFSIGLVVGVLIGYFPFVRSISDAVITFFEHPVVKFLILTLTILSLGWLIFDRWLGSQRVPKRLSRLRFGFKNAAWQPQNSKGSVIIMSLACCIIVAVGANRHDAPPETEYAFVAESSLPLHHSLNTPDGRDKLYFDVKDSELLSESEVFPFRVLPGEDVSCLNLYQPQKPQILGASDVMLNEDPWQTLKLGNNIEGKIHAIGDEKSLRWILHHDPKEDFLIQDEFGKSLLLELETVENSLFQSQLIISESDFTKYFPSQSGYQFFLIKTPTELREETLQILEKTLEDYGFDVTSASERLASFRAVENTYISTFQSLGGLGVLLGTFGLALVLFRNIIERRGELATLRAFGFRKQLLAKMLFLESCFLLTIGMLIGVVSGVVAILGSQGHLPSFPWLSLTITLLFILGFGIIANSIAVAVALQSPLLSTLKTE
ncbi:MAG: FtsX-like permease family protein [Candidatus Poribacteria bacterium]|nr:FtsX-like permease family protein [Candidatus Poribacteria bacterium]